MDKVFEILKEALRTGVLSVVSYLLTDGVINGLVIGVVGSRLDFPTVLTISAVLSWLLRGVEKHLHKAGSRVALPF